MIEHGGGYYAMRYTLAIVWRQGVMQYTVVAFFTVKQIPVIYERDR